MLRVALALFVTALLLSVRVDAQSNRSSSQRSVLHVQVTAYCVQGETASGEQTRRGIVAADPSVLPLGSIIQVRGLRGQHNRTYAVEDTGRKVKGRIIDIFMRDCRAAKKFGRQRARVRVIERGETQAAR